MKTFILSGLLLLSLNVHGRGDINVDVHRQSRSETFHWLQISKITTKLPRQKHSIFFGADFVTSTYPTVWYDLYVIKAGYSNEAVMLTRTDHWLGYSYENKIGFKWSGTEIIQFAGYRPYEQMPDNFLVNRQATFSDFMLGYNFMNKNSRLAVWLYGGLSNITAIKEVRVSYTPIVWSEEVPLEVVMDQEYSPVAQVQIKYAVLKHIFANAGATYHYVLNDFQPITFNAGLGYQFGVFSKK